MELVVQGLRAKQAESFHSVIIVGITKHFSEMSISWINYL